MSALALVNTGIAMLEGHRVLVAPEDLLTNDVTTIYFDVIVAADEGWEWKNQLFYETYSKLNENAYGFSQFHESFVIVGFGRVWGTVTAVGGRADREPKRIR